MKRINLLYIVLCALVSFTIIPEANAQTSSPRSGGPRGVAGAPFWTCPDTLCAGTITIDEEYINRKPGQYFGAESDYSINTLGKHSSTYGSLNFGQSLVGGRGKRYTFQSSEPVLLVAYREWSPCFFIAIPGQHLNVIRDASQGDSIVDVRENGRSILAFEHRDEVADFAQALYSDYSGYANLPAEYIHERLIDCATNPDVARRNLQPFIDLPFIGRPKGLSIGYSTGGFILHSSMSADDEEPTDDADDDADADETAPSHHTAVSPIYRKEHGGLARFRADLESLVQLPPEDELPNRGVCTLLIELGKKGEMKSHTIYHSFSPAFDAALSEGIVQLFPFDAPARYGGKPCNFRIILNIIYRKHGTSREDAAAAASDLSAFMPFINTFTLPGAEIPLAVKLADVRLNGKLLPHWTLTDYGDFVHQEPGMPSLDINSKAYDSEPYATWFTQLEEQLKTNLQMTQQQRDSLASAFTIAIRRYREHASRLPSFYETIDTKFNGESRRYVDHIFKTSLLFNRQRLNRFYEDLDHAHLFEDEGFNFLISVLDFAKQQE